MKSKYVQLACMLALAAGALAIRSVPLLATSAEYASLSARNLYAVNQSSKNRGSISTYDIDAGHRLIKTIHTVPDVGDVRGVAVSAVTGKLYVAYRNNAGVGMIYCVNVNNETVLWNKAINPGVDRLAINPNGQLLYVPTGKKVRPTTSMSWTPIPATLCEGYIFPTDHMILYIRYPARFSKRRRLPMEAATTSI
jgi:DNA-binding beta-propeller fold protein YncE